MKNVTCDTKNPKTWHWLRTSCYILHNEREKGFTLIETIVYSALLMIVISMAIYFMANIFSAYKKVFAQKEVMTNMQSALDLISEETKFAQNIYTPTSIFNNNNGQLSIKTNQNSPTGETSTYADFYLDNGRIYAKREGQTTTPLTSNQVKINKIRFVYLNPADAPEGAQIFIEGQYNTTSAELRDQTKMNFTTSAIIRYQ